MDSIQKQIQNKLSEAVLDSLGKKFGIDLSKSSGLVKMILPLILGGLAKKATSKQGAADLSKALDEDHDGSLMDHLDDIVVDGAIQQDGAKILGHVFGDKKSDLAAMVSKSAAVDETAASGMLETLAPVVLGQLGQEKKQKSLDADSLSDLLKGEEVESKKQLDGIMGMLDRDNDGSVMDDLLDIGKGFLK